MKNCDIFLIFALKMDFGYPQSMFWCKNKKTMYYLVNTSFNIYKSGAYVCVNYMDVLS